MKNSTIEMLIWLACTLTGTACQNPAGQGSRKETVLLLAKDCTLAPSKSEAKAMQSKCGTLFQAEFLGGTCHEVFFYLLFGRTNSMTNGSTLAFQPVDRSNPDLTPDEKEDITPAWDLQDKKMQVDLSNQVLNLAFAQSDSKFGSALIEGFLVAAAVANARPDTEFKLAYVTDGEQISPLRSFVRTPLTSHDIAVQYAAEDVARLRKDYGLPEKLNISTFVIIPAHSVDTENQMQFVPDYWQEVASLCSIGSFSIRHM